MFYRPPAQAIIEILPIGCPLTLYAEPDNPADANAVAVYVKSADLPEAGYAQLDENARGFGHNHETILAQDEWHLGYVPKQFAKLMRESNAVMPSIPVPVTFSVSSTGGPRVRFEEPPY